MDFSKQTCVPCQGGIPPLREDKVKEYLKSLPAGWEYKKNPDRIEKDFEFKNFSKAIEFINKVADVAEQQNHHPNIYLHDWKYVRIENYTHKINGLHENDFILASKIEKILE
jgi:4a-hydroxytetrahydrobiopterin dehydratase